MFQAEEWVGEAQTIGIVSLALLLAVIVLRSWIAIVKNFRTWGVGGVLAMLLCTQPHHIYASTSNKEQLVIEQHDPWKNIEATTGTYVVRSGDNLWSIAGQYVDAQKVLALWKEIIAENTPHLISRDPNVIYPNEEIVITLL